ncbi:MAG: hypothetical protein KAI02_03345 [Gammaproteobacteria bacterium]|nr:hypothetical protein [Gammaproteobacteria bacterium]
MNIKELLNNLNDYFDMNKKKRQHKTKELKALLKVFKHKEKKLIAECRRHPSGHKNKSLETKIAILHAKRKKGLKALKKLIHDK